MNTHRLTDTLIRTLLLRFDPMERLVFLALLRVATTQKLTSRVLHFSDDQIRSHVPQAVAPGELSRATKGCLDKLLEPVRLPLSNNHIEWRYFVQEAHLRIVNPESFSGHLRWADAVQNPESSLHEFLLSEALELMGSESGGAPSSSGRLAPES